MRFMYAVYVSNGERFDGEEAFLGVNNTLSLAETVREFLDRWIEDIKAAHRKGEEIPQGPFKEEILRVDQIEDWDPEKMVTGIKKLPVMGEAGL